MPTSTTPSIIVSPCSVHNDVLYGEEYRWDRCGELSPACQQYFIDEACLYECDEHAGRYRHHTNCSDEDANTWQMMGMPIKASFWDSWYEACKDDLFCGRGYFDMPTCNVETDCSKFSDIYDDAEDMATAMWNNAFTYERDEENAYTMGFEAGQPNPNDAVEHAVEFPDLCTGTKHDNITGEIKETGEVCHETSETSEPAAKTNSSPASTLSVTVAATLAAAAATAVLTV